MAPTADGWHGPAGGGRAAPIGNPRGGDGLTPIRGGMLASDWRCKARAPPPGQSIDLALFWAFSAFASTALGGLELVGQGRALSAVDDLCSQAQCGSLAGLTAWIVRIQLAACLAAVAYVLSCVALAPRPPGGCRPAVGLLLALLVCSFHLVAAIGQFAGGQWIVGRDGEALERERGEVVFGLCWCLTVVFVLMVLLLCADHAQRVVFVGRTVPAVSHYDYAIIS
ncbi:unnamed protein product [Ostreobium quekettii]|uniref:Uncharacterized protein n=1 Tax=Ostreobium quekettii TaxID=121088 RepID=A0A8S1J006_9CHLO|nr:unnamed protein product [Ostreobium quekettii]